MFDRLIPWKKRNQQIAVHRDEPLRAESYDYYPLVRMREEMDTLMSRFFDDRSFGNLPSLWEDSRSHWDWDLGWEDKGNEYVFQAELPGFEPENFDVKVSGNMLTVRAEHQDEKKEKDGASYHYGSFYRTFTLPHGEDVDKIDAHYHSGVFEVHLPKTEEAPCKRIEVKSA